MSRKDNPPELVKKLQERAAARRLRQNVKRLKHWTGKH